METHISYVILTGSFAYKIKKPVSLEFADFSTLELRRKFCGEEVRLNKRLAPGLYLGVVPICGSVDAPLVNGSGEAIEYAVKMRQFPHQCRLDLFIEQKGVSADLVAGLAEEIAGFHAQIPVAGPEQHAQVSERRHSDVSGNFDALEPVLKGTERGRLLEELRRWSQDSLVSNGDLFRKRARNGFVRECHGDMHLANMVYLDGKVTVFDALEFNPELRWIDVMSEAAFVVMDLLRHRQPGPAGVFLSRYLEGTGDYEGLMLLRHFLVYRALVRAKVAAIRAVQAGGNAEDREKALREAEAFVDLAGDCMRYGAKPFLLITCGVSGSGKSLLSGKLVERLGAVRIRSDLERRRREKPGEDRYSAFARHRTYGKLERCADQVLGAGLPVIADATFLTRHYRGRFRELANEHGVPFVILSLEAPRPILAQRITERQARGSDPSEATVSVLDRQLDEMQPLTEAEKEFAVEIESVAGADLGPVEAFLRGARRLPLAQRMGRNGALSGESR